MGSVDVSAIVEDADTNTTMPQLSAVADCFVVGVVAVVAAAVAAAAVELGRIEIVEIGRIGVRDGWIERGGSRVGGEPPPLSSSRGPSWTCRLTCGQQICRGWRIVEWAGMLLVWQRKR